MTFSHTKGYEHRWYPWVCRCPFQSCITHRWRHLSGLPRTENTKAHKVSLQTRHLNTFSAWNGVGCLAVSTWQLVMELPRKLAVQFSCLEWQVPGTPQPHQLIQPQGLPLHQTSALHGPAATLLLAYPSSWWALLWPHGNHTGLMEPGSLHCSTVGEPSATWTSAGEVVGHRKTHSTKSLRLMTLKKARDKAVNWLFWPDMDQALTQAVVE